MHSQLYEYTRRWVHNCYIGVFPSYVVALKRFESLEFLTFRCACSLRRPVYTCAISCFSARYFVSLFSLPFLLFFLFFIKSIVICLLLFSKYSSISFSLYLNGKDGKIFLPFPDSNDILSLSVFSYYWINYFLLHSVIWQLLQEVNPIIILRGRDGTFKLLKSLKYSTVIMSAYFSFPLILHN